MVPVPNISISNGSTPTPEILPAPVSVPTVSPLPTNDTVSTTTTTPIAETPTAEPTTASLTSAPSVVVTTQPTDAPVVTTAPTDAQTTLTDTPSTSTPTDAPTSIAPTIAPTAAVKALTADNWAASVDDGTCALASCDQDLGGMITMVDFFAPWCPHCQHQAPVWQGVAEQYSAVKAVNFGRVDCTQQRELCARFDITGLPTMAAFVSSANGTERGLNTCDAKRTGELDALEVHQWIDDLLSHAGILHVEPEAAGSTPQSSKTIVPQQTVETADLAATLFHVLQHATAAPNTGEPLPGSPRAIAVAGWLQLIQHALKPATEMDTIIAQLAQDGQPSISQSEWAAAVDQLTLWGHASDVQFSVCAGAHHGYACGLWQLFHSLTTAATEATATSTLIEIRSFVATLFDCEPCQQHFLNVSSHLEADSFEISSSHAVQWLWAVHNGVTERIAPQWGMEPSQVQYPTSNSCPACKSADGSWDMQQVELFMRLTYTLQSTDEVESNTSVSAGFGSWLGTSLLITAAVCGAMALCAWGILRARARWPDAAKHVALSMDDSADSLSDVRGEVDDGEGGFSYKGADGKWTTDDLGTLWDSFPDISIISQSDDHRL